MGLAILICQDPNFEAQKETSDFQHILLTPPNENSPVCSVLHPKSNLKASSWQSFLQDLVSRWEAVHSEGTINYYTAGQSEHKPELLGLFLSEVFHHFKAPEVPTSNTTEVISHICHEPNSCRPCCIFEGCFAQLFLQTSEVFTFLPSFQQLRTSIKPYLQLVSFLRQLHPQPFAFCDLSSQFLYLSIKLLPLMLRLCLDLLQHLHFTGQLLVVRLQALLVFFKICFELGKKKKMKEIQHLVTYINKGIC